MNRLTPATSSAADVQRRPGQPGGHDAGHAGHQGRPQQAGEDQQPAPVPAVQQGAGERADQRVRQQQHGQPGGHGDRVGLPLRVEQHRAAQRGLEHAVGPLDGEPGDQQALVAVAGPQHPDEAEPFDGQPDPAAGSAWAHRPRMIRVGRRGRNGWFRARCRSCRRRPGMRRHGPKATRRSGCDDVPVVDDRSGSGSVLAPGSLLVAAPGLLDPNFHRTVVYLIEHRAGGSLGVVLNRPSEVSVRDVLPSWAPLSSQPLLGVRRRPGRVRDRAVPGRGAHRPRPDDGERPGPGARAGGAGRPGLGPERPHRAAARAAGVRRVRRLEPGPAGRRGDRAGTGSSFPPCPTTC